MHKMLVVLDTNILVSALLSPYGAPARVFAQTVTGNLTMCYDTRMLIEYEAVLSRPKFDFKPSVVFEILRHIKDSGILVEAIPLQNDFIDESDKKFYEVAKHCNAMLVTGNLKHFPQEPGICTANDFLTMLEGGN